MPNKKVEITKYRMLACASMAPRVYSQTQNVINLILFFRVFSFVERSP